MGFPEVFFKQERANTCAVASLRSVLASQFGVSIPEIALRYAGDTVERPILVEGTHAASLRQMLEVANRAANQGPRWGLRIHRTGVVADLAREIRAGRYPLAAVQYPGILHMVVVCGYKPGRVRYFDPDSNKTRWIGVGRWRQLWRDNDGDTWYAVITGGFSA